MTRYDGQPHKLTFFLPNVFTALNMGCGFASIIMATKGMFYPACMILLLGAIFDSVDGRIARLTGTQSQFGEQFDSISDVISFGMAPALIIYFKYFQNLGRPGIVISFLYLLCGALRLARFNANINKVPSNYFQGLPIPGGALAIIGFIMVTLEFNFGEYQSYYAAAYVIFYSLLMISNIPFNSFKNSDYVRKNRRKVLAMILLILVLILIYEQLMIFVLITAYVVGCLVYNIFSKDTKVELFDWEEKDEESES
ncbi:CDP-diacylglycerol--serine O-phosphatidyltransferase [Halobacteriovorax sp. GFR7]|uniref:CDP-diacylglycerol--serine O-phosphatidyltransferase n=1 Tax=unclassified Halobacteriovorax TaxID=2639665 RepID=UPI0037123A7F